MNKIRHSKDATLERNNIHYWLFLIKEYNLTKDKKYPSYKFVQDCYKAHGIQRQNFIKYYNRYKYNNANNALLPLKRGASIQNKKHSKMDRKQNHYLKKGRD